MIIHSLDAEGFRIIGDPLSIQFPEKGRIGILGANESGKSTFLQLIEYALYGLKKGRAGSEGDRADLITWGKSQAKLRLEFSSGYERYVLKRSFSEKSHQAQLIPIEDGKEDYESALRSTRDIRAKIEQITGMDRDSYTKLVYIRQKDLDALKELQKSDREKLINKVMGIEIFDAAASHVKEDVKALNAELDLKKAQLEAVSANKRLYEEKLEECRVTERSINSLQIELNGIGDKRQKAKSVLDSYEWQQEYKSTTDFLTSLNEQVNAVDRDIKTTTDSECDIANYEAALNKFSPKIKELQQWRDVFSDVDRRLAAAEAYFLSLKLKMDDFRAKSTFKGAERTPESIGSMKHQQLVRFLALLVGGLACFFFGLFIPLLFLVALIVLVAAGYSFYKYYKADMYLASRRDEVGEYNALKKQRESQQGLLSTIKEEKQGLLSRAPFTSTQEIDARLRDIKDAMKKEVDADSTEAIEALLSNKKQKRGALSESALQEQKKNLENAIVAKQKVVDSLTERKPALADQVEYEKDAHERARTTVEDLDETLRGLTEKIQHEKGSKKPIENDLVRYMDDYERYPQVEKDFELHKMKIDLRKQVLTEFAETSRGLRNDVIPHARFIINHILPTLTDQRYSDFEITEDLKFTAYANEAGSYKDREIFSGGTQDQFLIALRLAFTQSILDSRVMADQYTLLMDECISSSDEVRKQGIFEVLDLMRDTFSQIFVIAHEDISQYLDHYLVLGRTDRGYAEVKSKSW